MTHPALVKRVEFALNDLVKKRKAFSLTEVNRYLPPTNQMDFKEIFEITHPILSRIGVSWRGEMNPTRIIVSVNEPESFAGEVRVVQEYFPDFMEEHEWPAIIELFKEKGDAKWVKILGGLLAEYIKRNPELEKADCIVPAPPDEGKSQEIGYDPCLLLAKKVSAETGIPVEICFLKARKTDFCGLKDSERKKRIVRTAFVLVGSETLRGKHVLLLDDVINSGATLSALNSQLKKAGAKKADALILSRGASG